MISMDMSEPKSQLSEHPTEGKPKRGVVRVRTVIFGTLLVGILSILAFSVLLAFAPDASVSRVVRRVLPFPVALADGAFISYGELDKDRESIRRFYETQADDLAQKGFRVDFSTPDGQKRLLIREKDILNKLIEDRVILALAYEKQIRFSESDVAAKVDAAIQEQGGSRETLESRLAHFYGWNLAEFQEKIVVPALYREAVEAMFMKDRDTTSARSAIEKAVAELNKGTSFESVALSFSDGESKKDGGDLGWTDIDTLIPELQEAARTQDIGVVGPIRESSLGFHVLVVSDRKTESGKEFARLRQIFTRKPSFEEWLAEKKREAIVCILPRRYLWDKESASVVFRDEALRSFEKSVLRQSEGDPSLIF